MISSAGIGGDFGISRRGGYRLTWPSRSPKAQLSDAVFTANGRSAIALATLCLLQWAGSRRTTVLVPAYLCPTMIQPLTELGLAVQFYPVADDLSVDPDQILKRIGDHTLSVMLLRYFGFNLEFRQSEISLDKKPGKKSTLTTEFRRVNQAFFARVGPRLKTAKR